MGAIVHGRSAGIHERDARPLRHKKFFLAGKRVGEKYLCGQAKWCLFLFSKNVREPSHRLLEPAFPGENNRSQAARTEHYSDDDPESIWILR